MSTIDDLKRQLEQAEARANRAEARAGQERERAEREKERADTLQRRQALSRFLDYIRSVEQHLYATFSIESSSEKSSAGATSVEGKFYPQRFRPWSNFAVAHAETFDTFAATFANDAHFPSLTDVEAIGRDLSPDAADEMDLRPFIRASIEKPAATVVSKYLDIVGHRTIKAVKFRSNAYGLNLEEQTAPESLAEDSSGPARKRRSPVKTIGVPDRWLFALCSDEGCIHVLVGEYKAAHILPAKKLTLVMSAHPSEDLFLRAARQEGASTSGGASGEVFVAKVLCQAYHYMITSGLEFGYVASGDGLILLRVLENDPNTLYYFWSVFPPDQTPALAATRAPEETAMAYLASLCMWAVQSPPRSASWIDDRDKDLKRWPRSKKAVPPLSEASLPPRSHDKDDGSGDGVSGKGSAGEGSAGAPGSAVPRSAAAQGALKRPHSHGSGSAGGNTTRTHSIRFTVVDPPTLPYCTQSCLRGLCCNLPLDTKCPNTELHRAAHTKASGPRPDGHALSTREVRSLVVAQLAENMDKDCECLDKYGCFGRHGVLFKITVTGYGYTFVAKGVQAVHRSVLQHEAAVYTALDDFQGRLMPVFLGLLDLERPIPLHSCARVPHMMLLSYAGPDLCSRKALPSGVDFALEAERTNGELEAAGLWNEDVREANLVWNEEARRVMQVDFDQAHVRQRRAPPRSPLIEKRDLNTYHEGGKRGGEDQLIKRARAAT